MIFPEQKVATLENFVVLYDSISEIGLVFAVKALRGGFIGGKPHSYPFFSAGLIDFVVFQFSSFHFLCLLVSNAFCWRCGRRVRLSIPVGLGFCRACGIVCKGLSL